MENKLCKNCNNQINMAFEFCPYCSTPITDKAKLLEKTKIINSQLVLLANLIKDIDDEKSLYTIDKFIKMLSKH